MNDSTKRAIVVGASSGIGAAVAKELARDGYGRIALVARREADLKRLASAVPGASIYVHDVTQYDAVPALFQEICRDLGGLDLIVYSSGVMPHVHDDEYDFAKDRAMIEVNLLGGVAWLNEAAQRFAAAKSGVIVGISSVAGDRGRRGMPVYGATKSAFATYLEALRNRLGQHGVAVLTIKPGPVDTPMTASLDKKPMLITPESAARQIVAASKNRMGGVYYVPGKWRPIMWVLRHIPSPVFRKLSI